MTPLAHEYFRDQCLPVAQRRWKHRSDFRCTAENITCFEMSAVLDRLVDIANAFEEHSCYDERTAFLPAPFTWIEMKRVNPDQSGSSRCAVLLVHRDEDAADAFIYNGYNRGMLYGACMPLMSGFDVEVDPRGNLGELDFKARIAWRFLCLAALSIINVPRSINRHQHMPHAGLERELARSKGLSGKFPLRAWTEIRLEVRPPVDLDGKFFEGHLTAEKPLHFCRAHLRTRNGYEENVRAHWRGNAALGIKRSRYTLVHPRHEFDSVDG